MAWPLQRPLLVQPHSRRRLHLQQPARAGIRAPQLASLVLLARCLPAPAPAAAHCIIRVQASTVSAAEANFLAQSCLHIVAACSSLCPSTHSFYVFLRPCCSYGQYWCSGNAWRPSSPCAGRQPRRWRYSGSRRGHNGSNRGPTCCQWRRWFICRRRCIPCGLCVRTATPDDHRRAAQGGALGYSSPGQGQARAQR